MSVADKPIRMGLIGCGRSASIHLGRLRTLPGVKIVGLADTDRAQAESLASGLDTGEEFADKLVFHDHASMLSTHALDAVAIFAPHRAHYRLALDALQAGCHVFVEKPLSTNPQEADDLVRVAAARSRKLGVGHQYRLCDPLIQARQMLASGELGRLRLATALLAQPWLAQHSGPEDSWRLDPRVSGGGIVADAGDHLLDAFLWTTGRAAVEVLALVDRSAPGLDVVAAAAIRLTDEIPATVAISGVSASPLFELTFECERGRLRVTDSAGWVWRAGQAAQELECQPPRTSIDADFIQAVREDRPPCCPAEQALDTVRLIEAIGRSAATGQAARVG